MTTACFICERASITSNLAGFSKIQKEPRNEENHVLLICNECLDKLPKKSQGPLVVNYLFGASCFDHLPYYLDRETILKIFPKAQVVLEAAQL